MEVEMKCTDQPAIRVFIQRDDDEQSGLW